MMNLFLIIQSFIFCFKPFITDLGPEISSLTGMVANFWLWQFLGRLHPMIVHFPIGLLVVALVLELFTFRNKNKEFRLAIYLLLAIGAVSALVGVMLGWFLESQDQYSGDILTIHKWTGMATAVLGMVTLLLLRHIIRNTTGHLLGVYRIILVTTVAGVTLAGHMGASLTHGPDFLTGVLPWNIPDIPRGNPNFDLAQFASKGKGLDKDQVA
ncbi:MAG: DUF2231 domain-containing protein [Cyclobacteriaceae bacterium]